VWIINEVDFKRMTYGIHEFDAVRKFSYGAWLLLAKPLNILHLCMGRRYSNTDWILLTVPIQKALEKFVNAL
jgi:hypothetical protein